MLYVCVFIFFFLKSSSSWVCAIFSKVKPQQYVCSSSSSSKAPRYFHYLYLSNFFREFTCPLCSKVIFFRVHVGDGGCFGSSQAECFLFLRNLNFPALFLMMMRDDSYLDLRQIKRLWIILDNFPHLYYSLSSLAILDAISLKPIGEKVI